MRRLSIILHFTLFDSTTLNFHVCLDKSIIYSSCPLHPESSLNWFPELQTGPAAPRSGGPQWICSCSLVSPITPGYYHEHIHPYKLTFKGFQRYTSGAKIQFHAVCLVLSPLAKEKLPAVFHRCVVREMCVWWDGAQVVCVVFAHWCGNLPCVKTALIYDRSPWSNWFSKTFISPKSCRNISAFWLHLLRDQQNS